jgi:hypothetical protein
MFPPVGSYPKEVSLSKFEIWFRSIVSLLIAFSAYFGNVLIDSYISVQLSPVMMFSNGPEQRFGQDFFNSLSTGITLIAGILVFLFMYPVGKYAYILLTSKENLDETA